MHVKFLGFGNVLYKRLLTYDKVTKRCYFLLYALFARNEKRALVIFVLLVLLFFYLVLHS